MCSDPTGGLLDFCSVYRFFAAALPAGWEWTAFTLAAAVVALIVINGVVMSTALYTWFERRAIGRFQSRLGPNRWGPYGLLQPFADVLKLIVKEDLVPADADRPVYNVAPIALLLPTLLVLVVIPFGEDSFMGRLNIGILFVVGITSMTTVAIFMGGWASRNKYAMLGAMRGVAMLISYEVPMAIAITGVLLVSGTMAMSGIVESQDVPFLLVQPLGFLVFLAASVAEMSRTPFDQIEAESELGAGYHTEYSGAKFAVFQLAEFMAPIVGSVIIATVFLGGTRGFDPIPGQVWFIGKVFAVVFLLLWFRATWPRLRIDQIMAFAWKGLFSLAVLNLFVVAVQVMLLQNPDTGELTTGDLWMMGAINWAITVAAVLVSARLFGGRRASRPAPTPSPLANMAAEAD